MVTDLTRALPEPTNGNRCKGEPCVECPPRHRPARVYDCPDGKKRCVKHYSRLKRYWTLPLWSQR